MSIFTRLLMLAGLVIATMAANVAAASAQDDPAGTQRIVGTLPGSSTLGVVSENGIRFIAGGESEEVSTSVPAGQVVMADGDPPILLAGEHDPCMAGDPGAGLQRSADGGRSWETPDATARVRPLAIWPDGLALAADCSGLKLSTDMGTTWGPVEDILAGFDVTAFSVVEPDDDSRRMVLVGMTSEGGTTSVYAVDLGDPLAPVVSDPLRTYFGVGGLAGTGQTYVQVAMDGAWVSTDAGLTWERKSDGLEDVTLEQDPVEFGLPEDFEPGSAAMDGVQFLPNGTDMVAGTANGVYLSSLVGTLWELIPGTAGRIDALAISADGSTMLYSTDGTVNEVTLPTGNGGDRATLSA